MEKAFLRHTYRSHCKFEENADKVSEIENGVKNVVRKVLAQIQRRHPIMEIEKIVEGGSYYEQTKIGAPDEFDFMVVLKHLSKPGAIILKDGCFPWYKKGCISKENFMFAGFEDDGKLANELVANKFWSTLLVLCKNETISETTKNGTISTVGCKNRKLLLKYLETPKFKGPKEDTAFPSESKELVHVPSKEIGVDLMLAIEYPNIEEIVKTDGFPKEERRLLDENGCHIVAKNCHSIDPCTTCWHVSLAASELQLMRRMDKKHKQSYQVLKYLLIREVPYSGKCANLSSYMLKNAFLFHNYGTNACSNADISGCAHEVLDYLIMNFRSGKMPCFLSRNIDTWGPTLKFPLLAGEEYSTKFMDEVNKATEWYAVCWLELWRRVAIRCKKLLQGVVAADDKKTLDTFHLMKESMMLLIECYCKYRNIKQETPDKSFRMPKGVSDNEMERRFTWYFGRLKELFDVKLGNLL